MRIHRTREADSNFDLNLAPFLDIIVSIVPLLLLAVAFVQIRMIETPVPQVVEKAIQELNKKPTTEIMLKVSKARGYTFVITKAGQQKTVSVAMGQAGLDFDNLYAKAAELKRQNPDVFFLSVEPESNVELKEIVTSLDKLRTFKKGEQPVQFKDPISGETLTTDLMFPKVTFGNILGG